jgi:hypothetical protein
MLTSTDDCDKNQRLRDRRERVARIQSARNLIVGHARSQLVVSRRGRKATYTQRVEKIRDEAHEQI